jgi:hypothetical protein
MAITYTWKITGLKIKDVTTDRPAAVVQTYWEKIGTDENGNQGTFSGATPFTVDPTDNSGPFIEFSVLTEQDVINWIKEVVVGSYEEHVNKKILERIDQQIAPIVNVNLPWRSPSDSTTPMTNP